MNWNKTQKQIKEKMPHNSLINNNPHLTAELKAFPAQAFTCDKCQKDFTNANPYSLAPSSEKLPIYETYCGGCEREMSKIRKISQNSKKIRSRIKKKPLTIKTPKTLTKPRSPVHKENTLAYYNCLIDQVANPLNEKVKITSMCHQCKHNKGKVKVAKEEERQQLVQKTAQDYLEFGKSLGQLLQADIVSKECKCK